jgi:hypothetical protein
MEQWDQDFVDLVSPGQIVPAHGGRGELHFGAVDVTLDWRVDTEGSRADFTFEGFAEGDEVSGRGWTRVDGGELKGWFAFHQGDESEFRAKKAGKSRRS